MLKEDWNEQLQQVLSTNEDHLAYNVRITSLRSKIQRFLLLNDEEETSVSIDEVLLHLKRKEQKIAAKPKPDIFSYGKQHIIKLQASGNIGNSISYSCARPKSRQKKLAVSAGIQSGKRL